MSEKERTDAREPTRWRGEKMSDCGKRGKMCHFNYIINTKAATKVRILHQVG